MLPWRFPPRRRACIRQRRTSTSCGGTNRTEGRAHPRLPVPRALLYEHTPVIITTNLPFPGVERSLRRRTDDSGHARPTGPSLHHPRDRKREPALPEPERSAPAGRRSDAASAAAATSPAASASSPQTISTRSASHSRSGSRRQTPAVDAWSLTRPPTQRERADTASIALSARRDAPSASPVSSGPMRKPPADLRAPEARPRKRRPSAIRRGQPARRRSPGPECRGTGTRRCSEHPHAEAEPRKARQSGTPRDLARQGHFVQRDRARLPLTAEVIQYSLRCRSALRIDSRDTLPHRSTTHSSSEQSNLLAERNSLPSFRPSHPTICFPGGCRQLVVAGRPCGSASSGRRRRNSSPRPSASLTRATLSSPSGSPAPPCSYSDRHVAFEIMLRWLGEARRGFGGG